MMVVRERCVAEFFRRLSPTENEPRAGLERVIYSIGMAVPTRLSDLFMVRTHNIRVRLVEAM
jgi:hypothetical protein